MNSEVIFDLAGKSTHLAKLEQSGLIKISKTYVGKKPATFCKITTKGRKAFSDYVNALEEVINLSGKK